MKRLSSLVAGFTVATALALVPGCGETTGSDVALQASAWVTLQGFVRDYTTNLAVQGVRVELFAGSTVATISDAGGFWMISNVPVDVAGFTSAQLRFTENTTPYAPHTQGIVIGAAAVQNFNVYLAPYVDVTGFVYAAGAPAAGATIVFTYGGSPIGPPPFAGLGILNPPVDEGTITATVGANGDFILLNAPANAAGVIVVPAYDADGDSIADYATGTLGFGVDQYATNATDLVINLIDLQVGGNINVVWSNVEGGALVDPSVTLQAVFTQPVVPTNVLVEVYFHSGDNLVNDPAIGLGSGVLTPLTVAFSAGNTFVTITPTSPLDPVLFGGGQQGTFQLEIGEKFAGVPAGANGINLNGYAEEFRVIDTSAPTITSPTNLAFDNDGLAHVVDSRFYYIFDSAFTPDEMQYYVDGGMDIPLQWDVVLGAVQYNIYARQILPGGTTTSWVKGAEITSFVVVAGRVEGSVDLDDPDFVTFDAYADNPNGFTTDYGTDVVGVQAFAEGRQVEFTITAVDSSDRESAIDLAQTLTLADNRKPELMRQIWLDPAGIDAANLDQAGGPEIFYMVGGFLPPGTLRIAFSEPVAETASTNIAATVSNPLLTVASTMLTYPGTFSMSADVRLVGLSTALANDFNVNGRLDFAAGGVAKFWLDQGVEIVDPTGNVVAEADIVQIDSSGNYAIVNPTSGNLGNALTGYTVNGLPDVRQTIDNSGFATTWTLGPVQVTGENIGTGNGILTNFTPTLNQDPIYPNSVTISYTTGGTPSTATDNGFGLISGPDLPFGGSTINYNTGILNLNFTVPPNLGTNLTATYRYVGNSSSLDTGFAGAIFDLSVGDAIILTYTDTATNNATVLNTTISSFTVDVVTGGTIIGLANATSNFGGIRRLIRTGDKFTVSGVEDTAGNVIDTNADTFHWDDVGDIVVTAN